MATKVKIFGSAWSPRHGNAEIQVQEALKTAEELPGVTTSYYSIAGKVMPSCDARKKSSCGAIKERSNRKEIFKG